MKKRALLLGMLLMGMLCARVALCADAQTNDEKAIRALNQRFHAAFKAKDVNAIMSVYVPDESLVVFDVIPPRQYVGAKAYRKDFEDFVAAFPGPMEYEITDLSITASGTLGFSHRIDTLVLTDKEGKRVNLVARVTDVYRKSKGKWLIIHEHVSVPVDLATGKPDVLSKMSQRC